ncbi:MAG: hypothetical protein IMW89_03490 [Ktedonobacteraceae bacterium]|nr:hypothetical protein [Ktedonobacteraceae bacterium]
MDLQKDISQAQHAQHPASVPIFHSQGEDEEAALISHLRAWGISYLTGGLPARIPAASPVSQEDAAAFLRRLARASNARVRDATIALLLLHPELAEAVQIALRQSSPAEAEQISVLTLATLYLQRTWWYRLTLALGRPPAFPEAPFASLWRTRHLPPPSAFGGRWGLLALERREQDRCGLPLTFSGDWQNQLRHLFFQEEARLHQTSPLHLLTAINEETASEKNIEEETDMSMRPNVDRQRIEQFLVELGRRFRQAGRLYLVGGAALVHAGIRPAASATTQDIDVEVASGDMYQTIHQLKQQLQINIEFASPADFIPLPYNWQGLSRFVGRYGNIDVFYFDFYSIALSKIERANTRDLQDVVLLLQKQVITLQELDQAAQEVAAQMGKGHYKRLNPNAFLTRYQAIRQHLQP